jgi:hypothetical protein
MNATPGSSLQRNAQFLSEFVLSTERESFLDSLEAGLLEPRADASPEEASAFSSAVGSIRQPLAAVDGDSGRRQWRSRAAGALLAMEADGRGWLKDRQPAACGTVASLCGNHPYAVAWRARAALAVA